ncbi:serine hydrolase domain-containing protein [Streptomyces sp. NPDC096311]|uniref:serine hydrolase domain-containing protein n=1 Tax=Streptomyces sp. NPDC096311 TaxID=3366083 RepID=UPI00380E5F70
MPAPRTPRTLLVIPVSPAVLFLAPTGLPRLLPTAGPSHSTTPSAARHTPRSAAPTGSHSPAAPATSAPRALRRLLPLLITRGKAPAAAPLAGDTKGAVPLTPLQAVRIALTHPPAARGRFAYSNTNHVLLGMVIRQVTGHSYATEAERRIIKPLRLTGTSFPGARTSLSSPHGRAYSADGTDVTSLDPRVAGAAGEPVTTLADLNRFYAALLAGDLLPSRQRHEMLDTRTAQGLYGMGLYPMKLSCGTTVWGHDGPISGSYVRTAATVDGLRVLTFRVNTDGIEDPDLEPDLLAAEFCPRTQ